MARNKGGEKEPEALKCVCNVLNVIMRYGNCCAHV